MLVMVAIISSIATHYQYFDVEKSIETKVGKIEYANFGTTNGVRYINKNDTVVLSLKGTDTNYLSNSLTTSSIVVKVDGTIITPETKFLSSSTNITNGVQYKLTLSGISGNGELSIEIAENTLKDKSNKQNIQTTFKSGIIVDNEKPIVNLTPNGGEVYTVSDSDKASIRTTINVEDNGQSGLNTLQYSWSTSNSIEPKTWITFENGAIITKTDCVVGDYYLWTKVTDNAGNRNTQTKVSKSFHIIKDVIELTPSTTEFSKEDITVTVRFGKTLTKNKKLGKGPTLEQAQNSIIELTQDELIIQENCYIYVEATDIEGNKITKSLKIGNIDKNSPIENNRVYGIKSSLANTMVLDVYSKSLEEHANVQLYSGSSSEAQRFRITYLEDGWYKIVNMYSGKALTVENNSSASGANLEQLTFTENTEGQMWKFIKTSDGYIKIKSKLGTYIDLTSSITDNFTNIQLYAGTDTDDVKARNWLLIDITDEHIDEILATSNNFRICSAVSNDKVLDIANGSTENGANVQIYQSNQTEAQRFTITKVDDTYYKIINVKSGKSLDVQNASPNAGANLQIYQLNGSDAQLWKITLTSDGYMNIYSKLGTAIDLYASSYSNGTNVQMYTHGIDDINIAQKWKLFTDDNYPPVITSHPSNVSATPGSVVTFSVNVTPGNPSDINYQWQFYNGVWNICGGEQNGDFSANKRESVVPSSNGLKFRCVIKNRDYYVLSTDATLAVNTTPPAHTHVFNVRGSTAHSLSYSWTCQRGETHRTGYYIYCSICHERKTTSPTLVCPNYPDLPVGVND